MNPLDLATGALADGFFLPAAKVKCPVAPITLAVRGSSSEPVFEGETLSDEIQRAFAIIEALRGDWPTH